MELPEPATGGAVDRRLASYDRVMLEALLRRADEIHTDQKTVTGDIATIKTTLAVAAASANRGQAIDADHEARIRRLESSDRIWAGVSILVSSVMIVVAKVVWP